MPANHDQNHPRRNPANNEGLLTPADFGDRQPRSHEHANAGNRQRSQRSYWQRAHRDWRIWVLVVLMMGGIGVYLMTGDLHRPFSGPRQPVASIAN